MTFDPVFLRTVILPFLRAAYTITANPTQKPPLPAGYTQTGLLEADMALATRLVDTLAAPTTAPVRALIVDGPVFGLMGQNPATQTAIVAIRGTLRLEEWLANLDTVAEPYRELAGFGDVHAGFQAVYQTIQDSLRTGLPPACAGCTRLLVVGHSLGGALAVLAAPDVLRNMPPGLQPQVVTMGGPRVGLAEFAGKFNATITNCIRIVNFLDIVPAVPLPPYTPVGTLAKVDSGGSIDPITRHSLNAYDIALTNLGLAATAAIDPMAIDPVAIDEAAATAGPLTAAGITASPGAPAKAGPTSNNDRPARANQPLRPPPDLMSQSTAPSQPTWPSYTGHVEKIGTSARSVNIWIDPSLGQAVRQNAGSLLAEADRIVEQNNTIFAITGDAVNVLLCALNGQTDGTGGADHGGCDFDTGGAIEVDAAFGQPDRVAGLFEAELSECAMNGRLCGFSTGEALSRWCAAVVSNNALDDFATAPHWMRNGMVNWVDQTAPTDQDVDSTGCGMAFISWLLSLGHGLPEIAQTLVKLGGRGTLSELYGHLSRGASKHAWPAFTSAISTLPSVTSDDPFDAYARAVASVAPVSDRP